MLVWKCSVVGLRVNFRLVVFMVLLMSKLFYCSVVLFSVLYRLKVWLC